MKNVLIAFIAGGALLAACGGDDSSPATPSDGGASSSSGATSSSGGSSGTSSSGGSSGTPSDSGVESGPTFAPTDLPGLAVWLDAESGVTFDANDRVTAWNDRSGVGNHAAPAPCTGPAKAAASLAGKQTLLFDGTSTCLKIPTSATVEFGAGDFAVFLVARYNNTPTFGAANAVGIFWSKRQTSTGNFEGWTFAGNTIAPSTGKIRATQSNLVDNNATSATDNLNDNNWRRLGMTRRGTTIAVWVNGVLDGTQALSAATDVSQSSRPVYIGGEGDMNTTGLNWLAGNIAEIVAVKGNVTDAQVAQLDGYLKAKFGL